jgi:3-oxoacyl-[acyl-carrier protein] reductase
MNKLEGRVVLVTGSSRGIGAAIARRLASDGASVLIHYNSKRAPADALAKEIPGARVLNADLASPTAPSELVRAAFDAFGALDILVNNAGALEVGAVDALGAESIDRMFAINVRAVILATREFAAVTHSRVGRVINISSIAGSLPNGGASVYAATKAAVESLTRSHATELGPRGITVNAVAPGPTATDMYDSFPAATRSLVARTIPLGRFGRPEDIAPVVAFLASDDAEWVTGQVINASGGAVTSTVNVMRIAEAAKQA